MNTKAPVRDAPHDLLQDVDAVVDVHFVPHLLAGLRVVRRRRRRVRHHLFVDTLGIASSLCPTISPPLENPLACRAVQQVSKDRADCRTLAQSLWIPAPWVR